MDQRTVRVKRRPLGSWRGLPLYLRILIGFALGVVVGVAAGPSAAPLATPARLVLRLLGAIAPALVLVAVVHALLNTPLQGRVGARLAGLLLLNTLVAITVGLLVANIVKPGRHGAPLDAPGAEMAQRADPWAQLLENIPASLLKPLVENQVIGVIFLALAFGIALRLVRDRQAAAGQTDYQGLEGAINTLYSVLIEVLHWVIAIIPFGVFGIVASIVGTKGFGPFQSLGWFVAAVILALLLQAAYYLARIRTGSWVRPGAVLRGVRDALVMAFSTASSTATMPVTYTCLRENVGLREESASMGALVGANFNNDGTALYEAMSALFIAQMIGVDLSLPQQLMVVLTSVVASVGAAGIPEAGLVTMTLVFTAVGLPIHYIAILLTVDWFLDRCRTAINVMGDVNVSCLLDGRTPPKR
ncbi:MAG: dicarboxylate/amino acid:cation symporter [Armatimonadetes bacterium]|nr:dicarboxylate/amino acid:cation symporter [Armatimonadota bacterium]